MTDEKPTDVAPQTTDVVDLTRLKEKLDHKESIIVEVQQKNKQLEAELESVRQQHEEYFSIVQDQVNSMSSGLDDAWKETISGLPLSKQLSILRMVSQKKEPEVKPDVVDKKPDVPQPKPPPPVANVTDVQSQLEVEIAALKKKGNATSKDWLELYKRIKKS